MLREITIQPPQSKDGNGQFELRATLHCGIRSYQQYMRVHAPGITPEQADNTGDVWAVLFAHKMMEHGGTFRLKGSISASLLRGLNRYTQAWVCLKPDLYQPIEIEADEILDDSQWEQKPSALACFSGGLDACFTAYRHKKQLAGAQNLPLRACLLVHGADIRKDYKDDWQGARASAETLVRDLEIEHFYTLETNFRDMHCAYGLAYYSMLAACMRVFGREYGHLMLGNDGHFTYFQYPAGNNPVTNHFLSSRACELVTDGSEFTRTEKAALVSQWPAALQHLRVCYAGNDLSTNCGKCPKCRRTRLNFMAVGINNLPCMPPAKDMDDLLNLPLNPVERSEAELLLRYLDTHPLTPTPEWEQRLRQRVNQTPTRPTTTLKLTQKLCLWRKIIHAHIKLLRARPIIRHRWQATRTQDSKPLKEVMQDMRALINSGNAFPVRELILHYFYFRLQYRGARISDYIFPSEWFRYATPLYRWAKADGEILQNKQRCNSFLAEHGIAVPRCFGTINGSQTPASVQSFNGESIPLETLLMAEKKLFIKPQHGQQGKGCMLLEAVNSGYCRASNEIMPIDQLCRKIQGSYLVEEVVQQHPDIAAVHPQSLNTLRIVTMRDTSGRLHYVSGFHRFGVGGSHVDNLHSGGIAVGIDAEQGCWRPIAYADDPTTPPCTAHPDTGIIFGGHPIPYFREAVNLCLQAHACFERIQGVGWDVAFTHTGPVIIEGNDSYGYAGNQYIDKPIRLEFETMLIPCSLAIKQQKPFITA